MNMLYYYNYMLYNCMLYNYMLYNYMLGRELCVKNILKMHAVMPPKLLK